MLTSVGNGVGIGSAKGGRARKHVHFDVTELRNRSQRRDSLWTASAPISSGSIAVETWPSSNRLVIARFPFIFHVKLVVVSHLRQIINASRMYIGMTSRNHRTRLFVLYARTRVHARINTCYRYFLFFKSVQGHILAPLYERRTGKITLIRRIVFETDSAVGLIRCLVHSQLFTTVLIAWFGRVGFGVCFRRKRHGDASTSTKWEKNRIRVGASVIDRINNNNNNTSERQWTGRFESGDGWPGEDESEINRRPARIVEDYTIVVTGPVVGRDRNDESNERRNWFKLVVVR